MEVRDVRTFVAVAELRHFARAASLCNLSQPAVSHQVARLEEEVGARLLNRASRRVSLTVAGEVFLEETRRILGAVDRAHERMQEVARGAVGRIRLGATATPGLYFLPPLLATYRSEHESYDLRFELAPARTMTFDGPDAVKRAVMAGLGIAMASRLTVAEDLATRRLVSVPVKAVLPTRDFSIVDHPQKHHGAACGAMLQLLERSFPK